MLPEVTRLTPDPNPSPLGYPRAHTEGPASSMLSVCVCLPPPAKPPSVGPVPQVGPDPGKMNERRGGGTCEWRGELCPEHLPFHPWSVPTAPPQVCPAPRSHPTRAATKVRCKTGPSQAHRGTAGPRSPHTAQATGPPAPPARKSRGPGHTQHQGLPSAPRPA